MFLYMYVPIYVCTYITVLYHNCGITFYVEKNYIKVVGFRFLFQRYIHAYVD